MKPPPHSHLRVITFCAAHNTHTHTQTCRHTCSAKKRQLHALTLTSHHLSVETKTPSEPIFDWTACWLVHASACLCTCRSPQRRPASDGSEYQSVHLTGKQPCNMFPVNPRVSCLRELFLCSSLVHRMQRLAWVRLLPPNKVPLIGFPCDSHSVHGLGLCCKDNVLCTTEVLWLRFARGGHSERLKCGCPLRCKPASTSLFLSSLSFFSTRTSCWFGRRVQRPQLALAILFSCFSPFFHPSNNSSHSVLSS